MICEAAASEREVKVGFFAVIEFIYSYLWLIQLVLLVLLGMYMIGNWLIFQKLGEPGWKGIVPLYNLYILFEKLYGNGMYALVYLACFVPMIGFMALMVVNIYTQYRLALSFKKDTGFAVGLILCGPVFRLLLGMDKKAKYHRLPLPDFLSKLK